MSRWLAGSSNSSQVRAMRRLLDGCIRWRAAVEVVEFFLQFGLLSEFDIDLIKVGEHIDDGTVPLSRPQ